MLGHDTQTTTRALSAMVGRQLPIFSLVIPAYLVVLYETLGPDWMTPERFRLGASTLLNDVLMQIEKERTGAYQSGDYFTID